ncbi:DUF188 domain-containing protein [Brevibacillus centrosporus]|uniref:UPF0178 protein SAMN05518846_105143 n=1 Tax=Brevibacillus centrosporus TaxID=54910 RepID=A0A1I3TVW7_9BACL|nr:DUF188 domain-containing protein [Brevibacillus centrosporus]MEC2132539.1 DUF188 domain-containing protein [Brevibacillus centrosporus]MED4908637.1 DUF188 domain-containing protein [Brevibacillus centrosporus]RNB69714.1 DUF188 domain-containing protein [Brevibacillus centrosporus]SFJ75428.1 hypothetical protein SAMN05518846_105143 [Brevibacillus centrosporus]GED29636.1 hypothetical protein BCE02nite_07770 [Brevibacillus centrosporus]
MHELRVLIDADACPRQALAIAQGLCREFGWNCFTYASFNHQLRGENHITVDAGPQAVDMKLANDTRAGDIVVTQDIGLAALILGKKAASLTPHGTIFDPERIAFHLEERNEKARFRRGGGRTRGPAARTREDDQKFEEALRFLMKKREGESD